MSPLRSTVLAIMMLGVGSACGHSPTTPTTPSLAGTWIGTGFFTGGSTTLRLGQTGSALSGAWTSTQGNLDTGGTMPGPSGTASGVVNGAAVSLTFAVDAVTTDCTFPIEVSATLTSERMTGTYSTATPTCPLKLSGNIVLSRTSAL